MTSFSRRAVRKAALAAGSLCLTLFIACSDVPTSTPLAPAPRAAAISAADTVPDIDDGLQAAAVANASQIVKAQLELRRLHRLGDVLAIASRFGVQIVGVNHAFRNGADVQVGGYDVPDDMPAATWAAGYDASNLEFLRSSLTMAERAAAGESDAVLRRGYERLGRTFRARLAEYEKSGPSIYSVRVRGRADVLAGLWKLDRGVRTAATRLPGHQYRRPRYPNELRVARVVPTDGTVSPMMMICDDPSYGCDPAPEPPPVPDPIEVSVPLFSVVASGAFVPDPISDPFNDNSYYDDNSVSNIQWAPSHGKSWVDTDRFSRYSYQYISWRFPGLTGIKNSCAFVPNECGFSIEHEVHQDAQRGIYGKGFYQSQYASSIWESSMPAAYLDTQFGDGLFAGKQGVQNVAIGTNAPQHLDYNVVYYNWVRFSQYTPGAASGQVQVAVQLGDKFSRCTSTAWCTLKSLATVRVVPWLCNYRAPNSTNVITPDKWLSWYYDGYGYKQENCAKTG